MSGAASFSLYLDLDSGTKPDIENVARAAIALSRAIKEVGLILDPQVALRVELVSGTEGSLSIDAVLRVVQNLMASSESAKTSELLTLKAAIILIACWFGMQTLQYTYEQVLDAILEEITDAEIKKSKATAESCAAKVIEVIEKKEAEKHVREVYRNLAKDASIQGVGISFIPGVRPSELVPRSEMEVRSAVVRDTANQRRDREDVIKATLLSPFLEDANRRWKFKTREGEFGASMEDMEFRSLLLNGRSNIVIAAGIEMELLVETREELRDGAWHVRERIVREVRGLSVPMKQTSFDLSPADLSKAETNQNKDDQGNH